jgi:HSP20 family protein
MYGTRHLSPRRFLPIDLFETDDELVIKTAMPGVDPEHLDVKIKGDVLTIHGEAKEDEEVQGATYHLRERRNGTFSRAITLPVPVQAKKAKAVFEDGVLTLTLPKSEEVKPKTIKVKKK